MTALHLRPSSIRARMTLAFSASIGLLVFVASAALVAYIRNDIQGDSDQMLKGITYTVQNEMVGEGEKDITEIMDSERRIYGDSIAATVVDRRGTGHIVRRSHPHSPPWPHSASDGWRVSTVQIGENLIVVGMDWTKAGASLRSQQSAIILFSVFVVLAASAGAWALVGKTLSPIARLSLQAREASGASLDVHLKAPSNDAEIVELVRTLNEMLARLEDAAAQRGRFYAAASHELRTPLQALSGHLELAASRPRTAQEYQETVAEANAQTRRLLNLTRDLLLLNQLDGAAAPEAGLVHLCDVCDRARSQAESIVVQRALKVSYSVPDELEILAPPTHVDMVVRNLVENAVKYASAGGKVEIKADPTDCTLEIFNDCEPIAEWLPERTFEAFYRPDASRNAGTGGNGLGLTICKTICALNGWPISVVQVEGGVRARVRFGRVSLSQRDTSDRERVG